MFDNTNYKLDILFKTNQLAFVNLIVDNFIVFRFNF